MIMDLPQKTILYVFSTFVVVVAGHAIALASIIAAAVVVAANAALAVVSPTPLSAARSVIRRFRHCVIVNTFAAGRHPSSSTFASRCYIALVPAIHHLRRSHRWLVVAFSDRPAA
jgi:hypothetical protein